MSHGIYSAVSGALAQEVSLESVANNVANSRTIGFRGDRVRFEETLRQASATPAPTDPIRYVRPQVSTDLRVGSTTTTGNPLDLAIAGDGYFVVEAPGGERLTRAGQFRLDPNGVLTTSEGYPVMGTNGEIRLATGSAPQITANGRVTAGGAEIDRLRIVTAPNQAISKESGIMLVAPRSAITDVENPALLVGSLESSNASPISSMTELIATQRTFDAFQRVIQGFRELDSRTARDL